MIAAFRFFHCMVLLFTAMFLLLPKDVVQPRRDCVFPYRSDQPDSSPSAESGIRVINGTYLGNESRNYYGDSLPDNLHEVFRIYLGAGKTVVSPKKGAETWAGAGWTGQPLLVMEGDTLFLLIGAFDHRLKKINVQTRETAWEYVFDDIVKGTGTIWENPRSALTETRHIVLQGSRLGLENTLSSPLVPSYRAISMQSGKALWKYNIRQTRSYSRDADGSALIINDTAYIGLENGLFAVLSPDPRHVRPDQGILQPAVIREIPFFDNNDILHCGGNLVIESSPCLLGERIYVTTGAGHVSGYGLKTGTVDWDFNCRADMNGSPVVSADSCLFVSLEKENIPGNGGVFKLDPRQKPEKSVVWYFPVQDYTFSSWLGGIIGSVAVNHITAPDGFPPIAAFMALDGYLYIVHQKKTVTGKTVTGPDGKTQYPVPKLLFRFRTGPSISTPLIIGNRLLAAGYRGIYLFEFDRHMQFRLLDYREGVFEATPVAHRGQIYIASRDGNLYCLGQQAIQ